MRNYSVVNLADYLEKVSEESAIGLLSSFSCPPNKDIELFLHEKALPFDKSSSARTFLVSESSNNRFVGYFTLAQKSLVIEEFSRVSKSLEKKINSRKFPKYSERSAGDLFSWNAKTRRTCCNITPTTVSSDFKIDRSPAAAISCNY